MEGEGASKRYAHDTHTIRYQMHTSHVYFYSIYFGTMHTFVSFISEQDAYIPSSIEGADNDNDTHPFPTHPHKQNLFRRKNKTFQSPPTFRPPSSWIAAWQLKK
jgi:hypothetical protein